MIYTRFGLPVVIIDARLEPFSLLEYGPSTPILIVDIQLEDGTVLKNAYGSLLKADGGIKEINDTVLALKGDLWEKFYRRNPIVRVFVWGNRRNRVVRVVITRADGKETDRKLHDTPASRRYVRRMLAALKSAYVCEVEWPEDKYNVPFGHFNLIFTPKEKRT